MRSLEWRLLRSSTQFRDPIPEGRFQDFTRLEPEEFISALFCHSQLHYLSRPFLAWEHQRRNSNIPFLSSCGCLYIKSPIVNGAELVSRRGPVTMGFQFAELVSKSFSAKAYGIVGIIAAIVVIARLSRRPNVSDGVDNAACSVY